MSNEHDTDNGHERAGQRPTDVTTKEARENARRAAETRRIQGNQGQDAKGKGAARNEPDAVVHRASQEHVVHDENLDRDTDDLYRTDGENEVAEWRRRSALDAPPARPGYVQRFIRVRLGTTRDAANWRAKLREGWRPVKASAHTDRSLPTTLQDGAEYIGVDDLVLCEMPEQVFQQRTEFYQKKLDDQNEAIERQLREQSLAESAGGFGPIEQDRRSSVSVRARTPGRSRPAARVAGDD